MARARSIKWSWLERPQPCRTCGEDAVTTKLGGRVPMHPGCDPRRAEVSSEETLQAALMAVLQQLEAAAAMTPPLLSSQEPGPCVQCHRQTRRYGPWGGALCAACLSA